MNQELLKEYLIYDPDTGIFTWIKGSQKEKQAGTLTDRGYRRIRFKRKCYLAHRLAFLYMTGKFPDDTVDHIDRNRDNNAWSNLRSISLADNVLRRPGLGIRKGPKRWIAKIQIRNERIYLGTFDCPLIAGLAYLDAKQEATSSI